MDLRADFVEDKAKFRRLAVASQEILTHEVFFKDLLFLNSTRSLISLSESPSGYTLASERGNIILEASFASI